MSEGEAGQVRILPLPGVFRPHSDTWMLAELLMRDEHLRGGRVLDLCTGSGALAVAAARGGAAEVVAVDVSRRAVAAARINAALNSVRVRALRGSLFAPIRGDRFDAIVSNPPYLPATTDEPPTGVRRAWDAGDDGRALLDRIVDQAPAHLRPGGVMWLVQSSVCGVQLTLERLAVAGLRPRVAARRRGPLGPLLSERAPLLERRGLLQPGEREEELVAIRAVAPPRKVIGAHPAEPGASGEKRIGAHPAQPGASA